MPKFKSTGLMARWVCVLVRPCKNCCKLFVIKIVGIRFFLTIKLLLILRFKLWSRTFAGDPKVKEMLDYNQFDMIDSRPPEWGWTNEMPRYRGPRDIERDMEQTRQRFWTENRLPMEQYKRSLLDEPQPLSRPLMQRRLLPDPPAWTVDRVSL